MSLPRLALAALSALVWSLPPIPVHAQSVTATTAADPPPSELAEPVAATLGPGCVSVKSGDVPLELWWVKAVGLAKAPAGAAPAWADVADGTLVGVVRVDAAWTDIRGYKVKPGVYTLRFALQPQNGDHLGVSPNREFLLLSPAAADTTPDAVGYKGAVDLSKQTVHRAHPSALSIDPPVTTMAPLAVTTDLGLEGVVFSVPAGSAGQPSGALTFGLILHGVIQN